MNKSFVRTLENCTLVAVLLWLIWSWWSFTGVYRLVAIAELRLTGSFGAILTFILSAAIAILCGAGVFKLLSMVTGTEPSAPKRRPTPQEAKLKTEAIMRRIFLLVGWAALGVAVVSGYGLWHFYRDRSVVATLNLNSPSPLPPDTGTVHLLGLTRPELLVGIATKSTEDAESQDTDYMAIVGPGWQPGMPVPVVVEGSPGLGLPSRTGAESPGSVLTYDLRSGALRSTSSGFAAYLLQRAGAPVDRHTLYLDTDPNGERNLLLPLVILGGVLAVIGLGSIVFFRSTAATPASSLDGSR